MSDRPHPYAFSQPDQGAFRIAVIYLAIGCLWILTSDQLAAADKDPICLPSSV
jgi:hypothetical protein